MYVPGEILVKFKSGTPPETIERFGSRMKTSVKRKSNFIGVQLLSLSPDLSVEKALAEYRNHPDVLYAEPNYIRRAFLLPNDEFLNRQWGLHNTGQTLTGTNNGSGQPVAGTADDDIDAPEAWDIPTGDSSIIVAVIDSGVDYTHPDLSANMWTGAPNHGEDFVNGDGDPMDDFGHGTHVAGIIGAEGNNPVPTGVAGVMWNVNVQLMALKILNAAGDGDVATEVLAIDYAITNGAKIINASFGGPELSSSEEDAIRAAHNAGIVFVAAAGNESSDNDNLPIYPASFNLPNVISVAASDSNDRLTLFSNFGKNRVDITAPGDCVYSTTPQGLFTLLGERSCNNTPITSDYAYISGTSMATPHVSGAAGLLLSQDPSLTPEEVRAIILSTADPREGLKGFVASAGRLNAFSALRRIKGSGLIGGGGGCGFPIAMIRPSDVESAPPLQVLLFLFGIFWPLLIPIIRKHLGRRSPLRLFLSRRRGMASAAGLLILMVLWPRTAAAVEEALPFTPVHSLALKVGYHRYDQSEYLDTNSGLVSQGNLSGRSEEIEYDRRWRGDASLAVTAGRYHSRTDLKDICCSSMDFSTNYLLFTPKYYSSIEPVEWYIGAGAGYYNFIRQVHGLLSDRLSANVFGIHAVVGLNWPVLPRISVFTEARYALAKVKSADPFNDALDVGGLNYSLGLSYRFSPAAVSQSPAK